MGEGGIERLLQAPVLDPGLRLRRAGGGGGRWETLSIPQQPPPPAFPTASNRFVFKPSDPSPRTSLPFKHGACPPFGARKPEPLSHALLYALAPCPPCALLLHASLMPYRMHCSSDSDAIGSAGRPVMTHPRNGTLLFALAVVCAKAGLTWPVQSSCKGGYGRLEKRFSSRVGGYKTVGGRRGPDRSGLGAGTSHPGSGRTTHAQAYPTATPWWRCPSIAHGLGWGYAKHIHSHLDPRSASVPFSILVPGDDVLCGTLRPGATCDSIR